MPTGAPKLLFSPRSRAAWAAILTPSSFGRLLIAMPHRASYPLGAALGFHFIPCWCCWSGDRQPASRCQLAWIFVIHLPISIMAVIFLPNLKRDSSTRLPDLLGGILLISHEGVTLYMLLVGLIGHPRSSMLCKLPLRRTKRSADCPTNGL
jgi:hypothetical protein